MQEQPRKRVEIKGVTFEIRELPPIVGLRLSAKLFPLLAAAFGGTKGAIKASGNGGIVVDPEKLDLDFGKIASLATPELLEELREVFAGSCCVLRQDSTTGADYWPELSGILTFREVFGGKIQFLYLWLFECLAYNFSDFLSGFLAAQNEADEKPAKA